MCAKRGLVNWIVHHKEKEEEKEVIEGEEKKSLLGFRVVLQEHAPL